MISFDMDIQGLARLKQRLLLWLRAATDAQVCQLRVTWRRCSLAYAQKPACPSLQDLQQARQLAALIHAGGLCSLDMLLQVISTNSTQGII
jgi:hypothetical protein